MDRLDTTLGGTRLPKPTYGLPGRSLFEAARHQVTAWFSHWWPALVALVILQFVAFTYLFTSVIFSNHVFPNAHVAAYPSGKTRIEGRFMSDVIVALQGGSGVQSFQMCVAAVLQAINGILLARILRLERTLDVFLIAAVLCLFPHFLDYYSFSIDILPFCLGDVFAVLGTTIFLSKGTALQRAVGSTFFYWLAISTYQPKIALVGLLSIIALVVKSGGVGDDDETTPKASGCRTLIDEVVLLGICVALAIGGYWISFKVTATQSNSTFARTTINSPAEMIEQTIRAYWAAPQHLFAELPGLPTFARSALSAGIAVGICACLYRAWKRSSCSLGIAAICIALIPPALRSSYILNSNSWEGAGRILAAHAFCACFFLGYGFRLDRFRPVARGICALVAWLFLVLATQQTNALAFKTLFEMSFLNRVVERVERLITPDMKAPVPIVVLGQVPHFPFGRYVRSPVPAPLANTTYGSFEVFRQPEFLNFFAGATAFRSPTKGELEKALESATTGQHPAWPAEGSVYLNDGAVVVLLEVYNRGMAATLPTGKP